MLKFYNNALFGYSIKYKCSKTQKNTFLKLFCKIINQRLTPAFFSFKRVC